MNTKNKMVLIYLIVGSMGLKAADGRPSRIRAWPSEPASSAAPQPSVPASRAVDAEISVPESIKSDERLREEVKKLQALRSDVHAQQWAYAGERTIGMGGMLGEYPRSGGKLDQRLSQILATAAGMEPDEALLYLKMEVLKLQIGSVTRSELDHGYMGVSPKRLAMQKELNRLSNGEIVASELEDLGMVKALQKQQIKLADLRVDQAYQAVLEAMVTLDKAQTRLNDARAKRTEVRERLSALGVDTGSKSEG